MRILVVNWQDWTHPEAGGAEIHLRETFGRLAERGHRVDLLCVDYEGARPEERLDGINVIRRGGSRSLFNYAVPGIWRRVLSKNAYDVVVDDLNKVPFFTPLFADVPVVALVHHLFGTTIFQETNPAFGRPPRPPSRGSTATARSSPSRRRPRRTSNGGGSIPSGSR